MQIKATKDGKTRHFGRVSVKRAVGIVAGAAAGTVLIMGLLSAWYLNKGREQAYKAGDIRLRIAGTDKARYAPGEEATVTVTVQNTTEKRVEELTAELSAYHLGEEASSERLQQSLVLEAKESKTCSFHWMPPEQNYQGYLLAISVTDKEGTLLAEDTIGLDVSSDWIKFPRYGYLCEYEEETAAEEKIDQMNRYHLNAIEYYDWHALHHEPLPPEITRESLGVWEDWAGRKIYGETLRRYLEAAHEKHMVNMAYNMIYAGTDCFIEEHEGIPGKGVKWQIYFAPDNDRGEGAFSFQMGQSPSGNGTLYFMNPLNPDWQEYLFEQENHIFEILDFDGWHGDTVGDWGRMTDAFGNPLGYDETGNPIYEVKETYRQFLNAAKQALGNHYLSFNPVGAQGIEQANTSQADVLYTEFWPWDTDRDGMPYVTYGSLVTEIERTMEESRPYSIDGKGKSLVVKAYINYNSARQQMNAPGVLLCDAAVYAAGGSRLELGNGNHMLHVEYYPDDTIPMGEELEEQMMRMADFIVAYENLLRDGQVTTERKVEIAGQPVSQDGQYDTIWTYTRADETYEILHLINLLGTDSAWRDETGEKPVPTRTEELKVRYYTEKNIAQVYLASFFSEGGKSISLEFETGEDSTGRYLTFVVPELMYWDMIYMR